MNPKARELYCGICRALTPEYDMFDDPKLNVLVCSECRANGRGKASK